jgi:serine/threonine protein kinase
LNDSSVIETSKTKDQRPKTRTKVAFPFAPPRTFVVNYPAMKYCPVCKTKYDDGVSFCAVDGEVLEDDPSSIVGTVLDGQYQIETLLGKGGMGAVFRARHILLGDRVAIKVLPPEMRTNAEWLRRFRREGQAARRFRHPNAVTVYDLRTASDGMIYMVMEYVEGHTLDAELKARGNFSPGEAVAVLEPIMSVLNAAHAMGVVHRDLKPENIMIGKATTGPEPNVKLLDLGIAKLREVAGADAGASTALTVAGQMLGTPYYMSPEQWGELPRDGNSEIDGRADIYSLGLVFYEMVAGRRPYSALTLLELRRDHVSTVPRNLDEVMPGVPHSFSEVIARAMAKDRSERPATAGELATELKAALAASGNGSTHFVSAVIDRVADSSPLKTVAIDDGRGTKSEEDTPTIITMDAVAPETAILPPPPQLDTSQTATATIPLIEAVHASARATTPRVQTADRVESAPGTDAHGRDARATSAPARGSKAPLIIGGLLLVLLLVGGVGGYVIWKATRTTPTGETARPANNNSNGPGNSVVEVGRYWIEVALKKEGPSAQVVPLLPIASGRFLRFHFITSEDGFLYIIGPGYKNKPTAFLALSPDVNATGWSSNAVKKGVDSSFPTGRDKDGENIWLGLDKTPGSESYTMIFSATRLESPHFLKDLKSGNELSSADYKELASFLEAYKNNSVADYNNSDPKAPFITLKSGSKGAGNPLVFDFRIEHR